MYACIVYWILYKSVLGLSMLLMRFYFFMLETCWELTVMRCLTMVSFGDFDIPTLNVGAENEYHCYSSTGYLGLVRQPIRCWVLALENNYSPPPQQQAKCLRWLQFERQFAELIFVRSHAMEETSDGWFLYNVKYILKLLDPKIKCNTWL